MQVEEWEGENANHGLKGVVQVQLRIVVELWVVVKGEGGIEGRGVLALGLDQVQVQSPVLICRRRIEEEVEETYVIEDQGRVLRLSLTMNLLLLGTSRFPVGLS